MYPFALACPPSPSCPRCWAAISLLRHNGLLTEPGDSLMRPITDYNEVTLHFIQCVQMHIQNTKSKVGSPAHTNSSVGTPFSNSMSQAATPTFVKSNSISCAEVVSVAQGRRCFWLTRR
ncbi:replication protein A 32 kDa subunit A [Triticum aestivum]|uniref:replication protein A 32 kDa subunit A n=1 Tax=Triticum aestivum TaxID=4565 RepID=UPI001D01CA99|nr:replication protein A 32 kDa subunit A-like [Triticum aestivum]